MTNSLVRIFSKIKFLKYSIGGILSYILNISITFVLTNIINLYYLYSYLIAYSIVLIFNFVFAMKVIFSVKGKIANRFFRFIIFIIIFSLANIFTVKYFTETVGLYYLISITIVTITLFVIKYFIYKHFVFSDSERKPLV